VFNLRQLLPRRRRRRLKVSYRVRAAAAYAAVALAEPSLRKPFSLFLVLHISSSSNRSNRRESWRRRRSEGSMKSLSSPSTARPDQ
jgi:hypothetical protein